MIHRPRITEAERRAYLADLAALFGLFDRDGRAWLFARSPHIQSAPPVRWRPR